MKTKQEILEALRKKEAELAEELRKMQEFHKAAWDKWGSELCAGEMTEKERKLVEKIARIKEFLNHVERCDTSETSIKSQLFVFKDAHEENIKAMKHYEKSAEEALKRVAFYKELAELANIDLSKP